jgi:hypothetical protein
VVARLGREREMLRIDRNRKSFTLLDTSTLTEEELLEREHLQEFISHSPKEFFGEINEELFIIGTEVKPSDTVQDRIDLLAIDKEGACVVIELKRGSNKLHMLQAISYAGMISAWSPEDLESLLDEDRQEALADFLECEKEDVNRQQRIILIAEGYDYALLAGAEWLSDQFGVSISCCRISVAKDEAANAEYLVCSTVYPAPELAAEAKPRGRATQVSGRAKWTDWESALADVTNVDVVNFFKEQLAANRDSYLPRRTLIYRLDGRRRWNLHGRRKLGYVWQIGRFENDIEFRSARLSEGDSVKPVKRGEALRMLLLTERDFAEFHKAARAELRDVVWTKHGAENDVDEHD